MGLPGFVLTLREDLSISVENRMGSDLPFEPAYVLADVERVFFPWLEGAIPESGDRAGEVGPQAVREHYEQRHLLTREFRHQQAANAPIRIEYGPTPPGADAPERVRLDNTWHRYKLTIETFAQERL
jgi:hypothetical protein